MHRTFLFTGPFYLTKAFDPAQKSKGTPKFYRALGLIDYSYLRGLNTMQLKKWL